MEVFEKTYIGNCGLKNRIIRSATFEGMADENGYPGNDYYSLYKKLSQNDIGGIITGFTYISREGKAMHPKQAGIDDESKIPYYKKITSEVHKNGSKIFMQIAHTGRQTIKQITGYQPLGVTGKRSLYFREVPRMLNAIEIYELAGLFGRSAKYAQESGFDGVQLHAAHGYLIHQFISPHINTRKDEFGILPESGIGTYFPELVIDSVRKSCGESFPLLVKISSGEDYGRKFTDNQFINLVKFLDKKNIDALEISYGTMDYALNIFRGDVPVEWILKYNPIYRTDSAIKRFLMKSLIIPLACRKNKPFTPMYNLEYASLAKKHSSMKIICVGGFRSYREINYAIQHNYIDFVSLCRPLIHEPDFVKRIHSDHNYSSACTNCNKCAIMCDSKFSTRCYTNLNSGNHENTRKIKINH